MIPISNTIAFFSAFFTTASAHFSRYVFGFLEGQEGREGGECEVSDHPSTGYFRGRGREGV
eukprot:1156994-Amorphochlora_amoeboformis.AAC.1